MGFQHIRRMLEGEKNVKHLTCLVKLGVAGVVSILAACGGEIRKPQIQKLPVSEIAKPTPEGEVIVGEVEQASPKALCMLMPHTMSDCGGIFSVMVVNSSDFVLEIEEPKLFIAE